MSVDERRVRGEARGVEGWGGEVFKPLQLRVD